MNLYARVLWTLLVLTFCSALTMTHAADEPAPYQNPKLPAEQREALILVGAGGFAYEEAADICACAVPIVSAAAIAVPIIVRLNVFILLLR